MVLAYVIPKEAQSHVYLIKISKEINISKEVIQENSRAWNLLPFLDYHSIMKNSKISFILETVPVFFSLVL